MNFIDEITAQMPLSEEIDFSEMDILAAGLILRKIPFERVRLFDGEQIRCEDWDAICHCFSHGGKYGLLEIAGSLVDPYYGKEVEGYLTAEDVLSRL